VEFFTEQSEMNEEDAIENQDIENLWCVPLDGNRILLKLLK
jgi:hypothetical protein